MTRKFLEVSFSDGSTWRVPAEVVASHYADYYAARETATWSRAADFILNRDSEITEHALNHMDWAELMIYAHQVQKPAPTANYDAEWAEIKNRATTSRTTVVQAEPPEPEYGA